MMFNQLTRSLQKSMNKLSDNSESLSTGKRINKPSDDAAGMSRVMDYKVRISENEQYMRNVDDAYSYLEFADSVMSSASSSLIRAKELAIQGSTGTQSPESRATMAAEVAVLRDEIMDLTASRIRDRYIFSGYKIDTPSFDAGFNYQGDSGEINVMIDRTATTAVNIPGDQVFSYAGTTFMESLDNLNIALQNNDEAAIQAIVDDLDNAIDQVSNVRAELGARVAYLDKQKTNLEDRSFQFQIFLSNTEDVDITKAVSEIAKTELALESLRQSGASVMSQSLLNFLR